jgi:hypothetical protein
VCFLFSVLVDQLPTISSGAARAATRLVDGAHSNPALWTMLLGASAQPTIRLSVTQGEGSR